jgi:hypothetical protein
MATELLSLRLPPELMASVRSLAKKRQVSMTAAATTLITTGLTAADTSAILNSHLTAAQAEIDRLKKAASPTSSPKSSEGKTDWKKPNPAREAERDEDLDINQNAGNTSARQPAAALQPRPEAAAASDKNYIPVWTAADRIAVVNQEIEIRMSVAVRSAIVGATLLVVAVLAMPFDWWFPRTIAEIAMGQPGRPEKAAVLLHGGPLRAGNTMLEVYNVMHAGSNPERLAKCFNAANKVLGSDDETTVLCKIEVPAPLHRSQNIMRPARNEPPLALYDKPARKAKTPKKGKR